ncbi:MAG: cell division protein FtsZ [Bacteroidales bacterium]|nr:cell division protein FtsZ [Bacteroidales bacterium]
MTDMFTFEHPKNQSNIIKVIGVGGGGSNAVTHMYHEGIEGVDFILCNTDAQSLGKSPVSNKIHLGKRNLGAGNIPAVGREAALETLDEIRDVLQPHTKMLFITAGMGGGTGTGAAPIVAEVARELDILTVGIVTIPFSFEGKKRQQQAIEGINELRKSVDTLLIISNDKLREEYGNMRLTEAFKKADDVLTIAAKGIAEIITVTGYINVDFEDVKTVMKNSGKAIMGSAIAEGENRALKAIEEAMRSPLLNDSSISGAKNILLYITSGVDEVSLDEVHEITDYIQGICGNNAEVIWGNGTDENIGNAIGITVIATGFASEDEIQIGMNQKTITVRPLYDTPAVQPEAKQKEVAQPEPTETVATLNQPVIATKPVTPEPETARKLNVVAGEEAEKSTSKVHFLFDDKQDDDRTADADELASEVMNTVAEDEVELEIVMPVESPAEVNKKEEIISFIVHQEAEPAAIAATKAVVFEDDEAEELDRKAFERQSRLKAMSMKLHTIEGVNELERQPAYMRKGTQLSDPDTSGQKVSRYSLDGNEEKPGLRTDNSFLHDNVD